MSNIENIYSLGSELDKASFLDLLEKHNISPSKKYGQNFIWNFKLLEDFLLKANRSGLQSLENVLEIGAGAGTFSYVLSKQASKVVSLEIDRDLFSLLKEVETWAESAENNLRFFFQDALECDWKNFFNEDELSNLTLVSNLPYRLTTALISKAISELACAEHMLFLVEENVVPRLTGRAGDGKTQNKNRGFLYKLIECYGEVKPLMKVPAQAFYPKPNVNSELIFLSADTSSKSYQALLEAGSEFLKILEIAFSQRRKTLLNCFAKYGLKAEVQQWVESRNLEENIRAENLSTEEFADLFSYLKRI